MTHYRLCPAMVGAVVLPANQHLQSILTWDPMVPPLLHHPQAQQLDHQVEFFLEYLSIRTLVAPSATLF